MENFKGFEALDASHQNPSRMEGIAESQSSLVKLRKDLRDYAHSIVLMQIEERFRQNLIRNVLKKIFGTASLLVEEKSDPNIFGVRRAGIDCAKKILRHPEQTDSPNKYFFDKRKENAEYPTRHLQEFKAEEERVILSFYEEAERELGGDAPLLLDSMSEKKREREEGEENRQSEPRNDIDTGSSEKMPKKKKSFFSRENQEPHPSGKKKKSFLDRAYEDASAPPDLSFEDALGALGGRLPHDQNTESEIQNGASKRH